jgi:hypothetical protein
MAQATKIHHSKKIGDTAMKTIARYEVALPEYSLVYLFNNDASGIDQADQAAIDNYMQQYYDEASRYEGGSVNIDLTDDDPRFTHNPAFGLACTVQDAVIEILADNDTPIHEEPKANYNLTNTPDGPQYTFDPSRDIAAIQQCLF